MSDIHDRLRHMARWLRIEAPLLPPEQQMAEFAEASRTLEALAAEAWELEMQDYDREADMLMDRDRLEP